MLKKIRRGFIGTRCYYCEVYFDGYMHRETVDHVIPRSRGGRDISINRIPCCDRCNALKSDHLLPEFRNIVMKVKKMSPIIKKTIHDNITKLIHIIEKDEDQILNRVIAEIREAQPKQKPKPFDATDYSTKQISKRNWFERWLNEPEPDFHDND